MICWFSRPLAAVAVALAAILALTGCSADGDGPVSTSGGDTISGSPSSASTPTTSTAGTPECTTADLSASYEVKGAAAGTAYGVLSLTNASNDTCFVQGYGGLSYVGGGDGDQVGAPARRDTTGPPASRVTLQPGDAAVSRVGEVAAGNVDASTCDPTPVDGFRVHPPDQTASLFVKHPTTGCAGPRARLLIQRPYR